MSAKLSILNELSNILTQKEKADGGATKNRASSNGRQKKIRHRVGQAFWQFSAK